MGRMVTIVTRIRQLIALLLLLGVGLLASPAQAQDSNLFSYEAGFGDTWTALSLRFQVPRETLLTLNPQMNQAQQPAPGQRLFLPDLPLPERIGRFQRLHTESLLALALRQGLSPYQLAAANALPDPYVAPLNQPILIPDESTIVRELPAGFASLQLSRLPAQPGQAIAWRGEFDGPGPIKADLRGLPIITSDSVVEGRHFAVGVVGTGAFYPPGQPSLNISAAGEPRWSQPWPIVTGSWQFQSLTLTGSAANIDSASIAAERERLYAIWTTVTPAAQFTASMQYPIKSYLEFSSLYGVRRSYNGGPYSSYHEGVDFSAYGGTPVLAPARGTVIVAETLYVRGGTVIIDHGLGIYTGVYHMSAITVQPGQVVKPGDQVGAVGTTGLSTGNHLHWDLLVNGVWVDALSWYNEDLSCWLLAGLGTSCAPAG